MTSLPRLPMVIDHLSKPHIKDQRFDNWRDSLLAASKCDNIYCKLSGMVTEADWENWKPADLKPYVETALECFGPQRCMFGSDWPVCELAATYQQVYDALVEALRDRARRGRPLGRTTTVVIAGRPNVGKSSLFNALLRRDRSIVHATPGTTRDVVDAESVVGGLPVRLVDTAGLVETRDLVEAEGVRRSRSELEGGDRVVLVVDARESKIFEGGPIAQQRLELRLHPFGPVD